MRFFALLLFPVLFSCTSKSINYEVTEAELKIDATLHSNAFPKDSLLLDSIRIIDISAERSFQPHLRLWGIGQPAVKMERVKLNEYLEGWFLLNNDEIALVYLSEHKKALYIKTKMKPPKHVGLLSKIDPSSDNPGRKPFIILLGTDNPAEMKRAMEEKWGNSL